MRSIILVIITVYMMVAGSILGVGVMNRRLSFTTTVIHDGCHSRQVTLSQSTALVNVYLPLLVRLELEFNTVQKRVSLT